MFAKGSSARWRLAAIATPALALLVLGWNRRWMADDAYIDLRVVHNILSGYGPVFNVGERVEAFTNPLWVGILSLWGWTGLSLPYGAVVLGLLLSVMGLVAAEAASLSLWRATSGCLDSTNADQASVPRRIFVPAGAIAFVAVPAVWDFATSGLETGLIFAWLGLTYWLLVRRLVGNLGSPTTQDADTASRDQVYRGKRTLSCGAVDPSTPLRSARDDGAGQRTTSTEPGSASLLRSWLLVAVVIGLGPLIRPDLALWSGSFLLVMLWRYVVQRRRQSVRSWPGVVVIIAAAVALPLAYELFRMAYFAALLPNTAYAKDAGGAYWSQGLTYLWDFVSTYDLYIPIILLAPLMTWPIVRLLRTGRDNHLLAAVWLAPVIGGLLDAFYVVRVGGDFMHARFLLPAFFGCLIPAMLVSVPLPDLRLDGIRKALRRPDRRWSAITTLLVLVWAIGCAGWLRPAYGETPAKDGISNERAFYAHAAGNGHPITPSDYAKLPFAEDGVWIHSLVEAQLNKTREASTDSTAAQSGSQRRDGLVLINGIDPKQVTIAADIPPSVVLVAVRSALGLVSYIAGPRAFIVDRFGLADPIGARLDVKVRGRPGHERDLANAWALARLADPSSPAAQTSAARAAEATLSCGAPKELLQAIHQPLTLQRLFDNVRVAVQLRGLTIPENPARAEAQLCRTP